MRLGTRQPQSPGPERSPTDISLAQLSLVDSHEYDEDVGEGSSNAGGSNTGFGISYETQDAPPDYESPKSSPETDTGSFTVPPIPSYDAAVAEGRSRGRSGSRR
jgi:hypothetical protein